MPNKHEQLNCMLCRAGRQGVETLEKARQRQVTWPVKTDTQYPSEQECQTNTTIDDSFSTILQYMSATSRQCRRYFKSTKARNLNKYDNEHTARFHCPQYTNISYGNPLQKSEEVCVELAPGTYAVTAGQWGAPRGHTQVVRLDPGQTVDMTFTCR